MIKLIKGKPNPTILISHLSLIIPYPPYCHINTVEESYN